MSDVREVKWPICSNIACRYFDLRECRCYPMYENPNPRYESLNEPPLKTSLPTITIEQARALIKTISKAFDAAHGGDENKGYEWIDVGFAIVNAFEWLDHEEKWPVKKL